MSFRTCIITVLLSLTACGSTLPGPENHAAMGFYSPAEEIIQTLEKAEKGPAGYFMLGTAYKEKKDYKKAIFNFANSCFRSHSTDRLTLYAQPVYQYVTSLHFRSEYYDDALYEIALLFYSYREYAYVVKFIKKISTENRGIYFESRLLLAKALQALKKEKEGIDILSAELTAAPNESIRSRILIRRASLYESLDMNREAAGDYYGIVSDNTKSWQAEIACDRLEALLGQDKISLTTGQKQNLAVALYHSEKYESCIKFLKKLSDENIGASAVINEYLVRSLVRLEKYREADTLISRLDKNAQNTFMTIQAEELWNSGRQYKSVPLFRKLLKKGNDAQKKRALEKIAIYLSERNRSNYWSYLKQYIDLYPEDPKIHSMLWLLARHHIKTGDLSLAKTYLERSIKAFPDEKYSDQCRYWLYKILEKSGKKDACEEIAQQMVSVNPDSPYTYLLLERLSSSVSPERIKMKFEDSIKQGNSAASLFYNSLLYVKQKDIKERNSRIERLGQETGSYRSLLLKKLKKAEKSDYVNDQFTLLEKYASIGHSEGIERIIRSLKDEESTDTEKSMAMAFLGSKYGNPLYAVYYAQQLFKDLSIKENLFIMPEEFISMILPRPFRECTDKFSRQYDVSIQRIYSVIKAESLFNHRVQSSAGAIGLMQLMPPTAVDIARKTGIKKYDLKDPCTSIHFGAFYLNWLQIYLKNNFVHMVAAYNAGAGNVNKWTKKIPGKDIDYFTEFVPYRETRYYILRTGKYERQYAITDGL